MFKLEMVTAHGTIKALRRQFEMTGDPVILELLRDEERWLAHLQKEAAKKKSLAS